MTDMLEKTFKNVDLGIEIESYIDKKLRIWFKAKEVAQILGYKNTEKAIKRHVKILFNNHHETHGCSMTYFIDEPGFYELVFKSRLPSARIFREWVFSKVLPSIRKYGYFKMFDNLQSRKVIINGKEYYKHPVFDNYAASKIGNIINIKTKKNLSKKKNNGNGYLIFCLCNEKLEEKKNYYQHRFVYEVFKGMIPSIMEIDHRNSIRNDNRIKNLQLLTPTQNKQKSNNKPIISINIENGRETRFISIKTASNKLNIDSSLITAICKGKFKTATSKSDGCKYTFKYLD